MQALRLLEVDQLDARIAYYEGATIDAALFVAQAEHVASALPRAAHVINLAENRYLFLLGWVAACRRGQVTLLPSGRADGVLAKLRAEYPDHHTIDDAWIGSLLAQAAGPGVKAIRAGWPADGPADWQVPPERIVAIAFTSGSTGESTAHPKTWGSLLHNSQLAAAEVLGGANRTLVSTVPPQHMYGLEVSVLSALTAQSVLFDGKPFYPADVRRALENVPAPRVLVTTPAHLKVLADAAIELPPLDRVVSATAPLARDLAQKIEAGWHTQVMEIYGCTEAGVVANRRPATTESWRTFGGGTITVRAGSAEYSAPQHPAPVPLQDVLELRSPTEFLLRGRAADMVKVAGKRASLQELTRQILAMPGVRDAVVFLPDIDSRPAAVVVAPGRAAADILRELRTDVEGVFVPRPLIVVDELPRDSLGKLPREKLLELLRKRR
jgi:acyl-coenzyme A synthetase/AMP-(fatty) acid ligase